MGLMDLEKYIEEKLISRKIIILISLFCYGKDVINFRLEVPLHSVKDIKRPTLCAEDAEECHIINKTTPALPVDTQPPEQENV